LKDLKRIAKMNERINHVIELPKHKKPIIGEFVERGVAIISRLYRTLGIKIKAQRIITP